MPLTEDIYLRGANNSLIESTMELCKYTLSSYGLSTKLLTKTILLKHIKHHLSYTSRSIKKIKESEDTKSDSSISLDLPFSLRNKPKRIIQPPAPPD